MDASPQRPSSACPRVKRELSPEARTLIGRAQRGEADAMRELALAWQPRVRNLVRYLVQGDHQVDDLAQQALLKAFEALPRFRGDGRVEAWLDGIVLRVTLRAMRRFRLLRAREVEHQDEVTRVATCEPSRFMDRRKLAHALDQLALSVWPVSPRVALSLGIGRF